MSRRVSLPGASELFGGAAPKQTRPRSAPPPTDRRRAAAGSRTAVVDDRKSSGRVRHATKITVYVTEEELLGLEQTRLALRADHGLTADRGRIVREAIDVVLADFVDHGPDSVLVRRLKASEHRQRAGVESSTAAGSELPVSGRAENASDLPIDSPGYRPGAGGAEGKGFSVHLVNFEGPFDLLLQLISKHKLDITEIALSVVTDEFIAHIKAMGPEWDLDQTSEFLLIAATLLDLKAARLLPQGRGRGRRGPGAAGGAGSAVRAAAAVPGVQADRGAGAGADGGRGASASRGRSGWSRGSPSCCRRCCSGSIPAGLAALAAQAMAPKTSPEGVSLAHLHAPAVTVREQALVIVDRLRRQRSTTFRALVSDSPDTGHDGVPVPRPAGAVPRGSGHVRPGDAAGRADHPLDRQRRGRDRRQRRVRRGARPSRSEGEAAAGVRRDRFLEPGEDSTEETIYRSDPTGGGPDETADQ